MAVLRNHKSFWMRDDAEASLARWEADHGIIGVNSAGRYLWEQQGFIDRWDKGGPGNRPPHLYEPKRPAYASAHVANGGRAFDTSEWRRFLQTCAAYGWVQVYDWDVVHFEYFPERDKHRNRPAGGGSISPSPTPDPVEDEEEDMKDKYMWYRRQDGVIVNAIYNTISGYFQAFESNNGKYNSDKARGHDLAGPTFEVSASDWESTKKALAEVRQGK